MKAESMDDLKAKIAELEERDRRLTAELKEFIAAEAVMIAAGVVSEDKVKQAHAIVRDF